MEELRRIELIDIDGFLTINQDANEIFIKRYVGRGNVTNVIKHYEHVSSEFTHTVKKLTIDIAGKILDRILTGEEYSSSYIFVDGDVTDKYFFEKSAMEHKYTSTGIKFWRHVEQMMSYKNGGPNTVVSTHISPEGTCNLKCPYCSVTYRDTHSRIDIDIIRDYVQKLKSRGLRGVILTGGGEPTLYKQFDELVQWIKYDQNLSIALITNGTNTARVSPKTWGAFSWVRVSINMFPGWENRITLPHHLLNKDCVVGASAVMTVEHQMMEDKYMDKVVMLKKMAEVADRINAKYVRILPNCLLQQEKLILMHKNIEKLLFTLNDSRFFHQHKLHGAPNCGKCHQAYFRPYLSEEPYYKNKKPGAVYPCDSVVLNNSNQRFLEKYQICSAEDVLDFLDRKIEMAFDPRKECMGCVFTSNVNMLNEWVNNGTERFGEFLSPLDHEEFV